MGLPQMWEIWSQIIIVYILAPWGQCQKHQKVINVVFLKPNIASVSLQGTEVKAITYSNMQIYDKEDQHEVFVIIDI